MLSYDLGENVLKKDGLDIATYYKNEILFGNDFVTLLKKYNNKSISKHIYDSIRSHLLVGSDEHSLQVLLVTNTESYVLYILNVNIVRN